GDAVRVMLNCPQCTEQDYTTNTLKGSQFTYEIQVKDSVSSSFTTVVNEVVRGKCTSPYIWGREIPLDGTGPWTIRVIRVSDDPANTSIQNRFYGYAVFNITYVKLNYANSVVTGWQLPSKNYSAIPEFLYHLDLMLVRIPKNYNP